VLLIVAASCFCASICSIITFFLKRVDIHPEEKPMGSPPIIKTYTDVQDAKIQHMNQIIFMETSLSLGSSLITTSPPPTTTGPNLDLGNGSGYQKPDCFKSSKSSSDLLASLGRCKYSTKPSPTLIC
jgi:hypothetical protein